MSENNEDRSMRIHKQFESILPQLWEKARTHHEELKSAYIKNLLTKLHGHIQSLVSAPLYETYFKGLNIQELTDDYKIVFGTESKMNMKWLDQRYSSMLIEALKIITGDDYTISFEVNDMTKGKAEKPKVKKCVFCGSDDVPNVSLSILLRSDNALNITVTTMGAKCSGCKEEYYSMKDTDAIIRIERLLKELYPNTRSDDQ